MTTTSPRSSSRLFHWARTSALLLAIGAIAACGGNPDSTPVTPPDPAPTTPPAPPPERVVEVVASGAGRATVVFESGLGADWTPWGPVASEIGNRARTFAYSRPGYGQSDPSTTPRDASHIVEELRALLSGRGFAPPYLLVGHSFGGAYMELFAKAHPQEVIGVVLVDPRHRDFTAACTSLGVEGCSISPLVVATLPRVEIDEIEAFARVSAEIGPLGPFGAYPVRVLTATSHGFAPAGETLWQSLLGSLASEASDGAQTVYAGAGHYLQLEHAHDVAQTILDLLPAPND